MSNRELTLFLVLTMELATVGIYEDMVQSMTKDSKIQQLEFELSQIPKVCIEQFGVVE